MCLINALDLKTIKGTRVIPVDKDGFIRWHIREDKITADMDKMKVVMAFENGFKILEKYFCPIQFKSTSNIEEAPIVIGFYSNGDEGLPSPFTEDTLAYAYGNYQNYRYASDMFFNDKYNWSELNKPDQYNLCKTFVHECMHALGFDHSDIKTDILYWQYQPNDEINFSEDTIAAIKKYYKGEMAKVPGQVKSEVVSDVKNFLITIKFKEYGFSFPEMVISNIAKYLGLVKGTKRNNYRNIVNYLDA